MLKALKKGAMHHRQAADMGLNTLLKTPIASLLTLLVIAIALLLPALLWLLTHTFEVATEGFSDEGRFSVYLAQNTSHEVQIKTLQAIKANALVRDATLISPEQGLELLKKQEGMSDILTYVGRNPLPPVIEIVPALTTSAALEINKLQDDLKKMQAVTSIKLDKQWVARLNAFVNFLSQMASGLFILLGAGVVLIIGNTLRMMIEHRREEIEVLKLMGASHRYIMRPYLYIGAIYAGLGAILAILLLQLTTLGFAVLLNQVLSLYDIHLPIIGFTVGESLIFVLGAALLGSVGARLSVKSQLAFIEP